MAGGSLRLISEAAGATSLSGESLGTTSDRYVYDRVKGRESISLAVTLP